MSRTYNVIDADGHILEPLDLWAKYMDPKFRDRAPRLVTDNATGKEKLLVDQQMLTTGGVMIGPREGELVSSLAPVLESEENGDADLAAAEGPAAVDGVLHGHRPYPAY